MLRAVKIYIQDECIYNQNYGKSLDEASFNSVLQQIMKEAFKYDVEEVKYHDFFKYRISFLPISAQKILFLFISDLSDKFESIQKEIQRCKKEFMSMFSGVLGQSIDAKTFAIFDPTVESIHKNLRPKISLVGFSGVGKTTITRLIRAEEIPTKHIPTITGDIATIKIGNLHFHLWDFAGQEQFSFLWNNFVHGSDAVLIITDSTLENVEKSKYFMELIKKEAPYAHQAVIGNKQDLPNALPLADLERILKIKTYSMVATDSSNRDKMITIIADILEMSSEVSPLLRPLIERDKQVKAAEEALEKGDFHQAIQIFMEVSDLCLTLGDDVVSQEFQEKAMKIKNILKTVEEESGDTKTESEPETDSTESIETKDQNEKSEEKSQPSSLQKPVIPPPPPASSNIQSTSDTSKESVQAKPSTNMDQLNMMAKGLGESSAIVKPKFKKPEVKKPSEPIETSPIPEPVEIPTPAPSQVPVLNSPKNPIQEENISDSKLDDKNILKNQISELETQITDLKIKLTDISKHIIDLDMENIMGTLSNEDFEEKQKKFKELETVIQGKIAPLEELKEQRKKDLENL